MNSRRNLMESLKAYSKKVKLRNYLLYNKNKKVIYNVTSCPICKFKLNYNNYDYIILKCGHFLHTHCFKAYITHFIDELPYNAKPYQLLSDCPCCRSDLILFSHNMEIGGHYCCCCDDIYYKLHKIELK